MKPRTLLVCLIAFSLIASSFVLADKGGVAANKSSKSQGQLNKSSNPGKNNTPSVNKSKGKSVSVDKQDEGNTSSKKPKVVVAKVKNKTQLNNQMQLAQINTTGNKEKQKVFRNQNAVRETVMILLALRKEGNLSGGIGRNVSAIARNFSNSVNKTIEAEQRIMSRGGLTRMLFGGDENAAQTIQSQLNKNRVLLQK